jgi:hypothetical protein
MSTEISLTLTMTLPRAHHFSISGANAIFASKLVRAVVVGGAAGT